MALRRLALLLILAGSVMVVSGVGLLSVPAALILAGCICGGFGVALARTR